MDDFSASMLETVPHRQFRASVARLDHAEKSPISRRERHGRNAEASSRERKTWPRQKGWADQRAIDRDAEAKKWWLDNDKKPTAPEIAEKYRIDKSYARKLVRRWNGAGK